MWEAIVQKGKNTGHKHFLLFPQCVQILPQLDCHPIGLFNKGLNSQIQEKPSLLSKLHSVFVTNLPKC